MIPQFRSVPSNQTKTFKYRVWSLDVWGHGSDECNETLGCSCIVQCEECEGKGCDDCDLKGTIHDTDGHECDGDFTVNDRCDVGEIECTAEGTYHNVGTPHQFESFHVSDEELLRVLITDNFIKEEITLKDIEFDSSDGDFIEVNRKDDGRPILQLDKVAE